MGEAEVAELFQATMRLAASWTTPQVLRNYVGRSGSGIQPGQYQTPRTVGAAGPIRLRDLADATAMTPGNASKIVAELVDAGLVTRRVPRNDRRVTLIELTESGRAAVERLDQVGRAMLEERLSEFTAAEVDVLAALLVRLADATTGWLRTLDAREDTKEEAPARASAEGDAA